MAYSTWGRHWIVGPHDCPSGFWAEIGMHTVPDVAHTVSEGQVPQVPPQPSEPQTRPQQLGLQPASVRGMMSPVSLAPDVSAGPSTTSPWGITTSLRSMVVVNVHAERDVTTIA